MAAEAVEYVLADLGDLDHRAVPQRAQRDHVEVGGAGDGAHHVAAERAAGRRSGRGPRLPASWCAAIERSQAKLNWQPCQARAAPADHAADGLRKADCARGSSTTCATAAWLSRLSPRDSVIDGGGQAVEIAGGIGRVGEAERRQHLERRSMRCSAGFILEASVNKPGVLRCGLMRCGAALARAARVAASIGTTTGLAPASAEAEAASGRADTARRHSAHQARDSQHTRRRARFIEQKQGVRVLCYKGRCALCVAPRKEVRRLARASFRLALSGRYTTTGA